MVSALAQGCSAAAEIQPMNSAKRARPRSVRGGSEQVFEAWLASRSDLFFDRPSKVNIPTSPLPSKCRMKGQVEEMEADGETMTSGERENLRFHRPGMQTGIHPSSVRGSHHQFPLSNHIRTVWWSLKTQTGTRKLSSKSNHHHHYK